ncbi:hypothetical protein [Alcaligenes faecalis]|uniref:hypothetical protein n=1 Tax=Alcaligenes faecalis TaxID=511 RepID=UPI0024BC8A85|nr:hypothetical protein [Alcaligenes faecalis]WHQ44238.1 hypothetical protein E8D21_11870 [Alcaligenes faecalis]
MKKEDADQLIRCVKECWWRVGLLLFLIFIFVLLVMHGWPQGDWGIGWGALGALATCVTGCAAVLIAFGQKKTSDEQRVHLDWLATRDANRLINLVNQELIKVVLETEKLILPENLNSSKWIKVLAEVVSIRKKLPRDNVGYETKNLLDEGLIHALHELKENISDLDEDAQEIDFDSISHESVDLTTVAIWLQNEMVPLKRVADAVGQGFEGLGFKGLRRTILERFANALTGVRSVFWGRKAVIKVGQRLRL